jgi:prevent-host-death family protein
MSMGGTVRQLRNNLSDYLEQVQNGDEVVVTDRGLAVARIIPMAGGRAFDRLVAEGLATLATKTSRARPRRRVHADGIVSDLVTEQRR